MAVDSNVRCRPINACEAKSSVPMRVSTLSGVVIAGGIAAGACAFGRTRRAVDESGGSESGPQCSVEECPFDLFHGLSHFGFIFRLTVVFSRR